MPLKHLENCPIIILINDVKRVELSGLKNKTIISEKIAFSFIVIFLIYQ